MAHMLSNKGLTSSTHRGQYYGIGFERRSFVWSTNKETGDKSSNLSYPWGAVKLVSCGRAAGSKRRAGGADSRRALGLGHAWLGVGKGLQHSDLPGQNSSLERVQH